MPSIFGAEANGRGSFRMIFVDADACPVKDEIYRVALRHGIGVRVVSNGGIRPHPSPLIESVYVPDGPDEADKWIAERCGGADIVVTQDIVLASVCLKAGAAVLKPNGETLTPANIGNVLAGRDLIADLRAADPFRQGQGRPFSKADRSAFLNALEREVQRAKKG